MSRWLELPVVGNRNVIVDGRAILALEGPGGDETATPDRPITLMLRGGDRIEGVIGVTVNSILVWMHVVAQAGVVVTFFDKFWEDISRV